MKSFRQIIKESPVGSVGRTSGAEALAHIENNGLEKKFAKLVKELGGKTAARLLLAKMSQAGDIVTEKANTIEAYLRDMGYKIKSEEPTKDGKEIEFFKKAQAEEAFEDLKAAGFNDKFNLDLAHTILTYKKAK